MDKDVHRTVWPYLNGRLLHELPMDDASRGQVELPSYLYADHFPEQGCYRFKERHRWAEIALGDGYLGDGFWT